MVGGERGTSVQTVAAGGAVAAAIVTPELKHGALVAAEEVRACRTRGCRSPKRRRNSVVFGLCWYTTGCGCGGGDVVQAGRRV